MPSILHVNASPREAHSQSLQLARLFLDTVREHTPGVEVETLNLFDQGVLPEFGTTAAQAKMAIFTGQDQTPAQMRAWEDARAVFDRFAAADAYVFNIPMWNAGVPYALKQWVDIVTQPGWSFGFDPETGYRGLMENKHAVAIHTSGVFTPGIDPAFGSDYSSTFFADWLEFVGIEDAAHIRFAPTVLNADPEATRLVAEAELAAHAPRFAARLESALVRD
ncbi:NAD(P)H-dependent oxidoreductase [Sinomonas sp. ASV322]|uniref:FMN-dependent NADH-azoreductase n=1 Tax=Sinomonas sp. ASV322 TaxID=3041920 RepID=UPI0027DB412D|nr:NAD(P)H-dependent oxidoreductase [Sinomonas sp. ASV322]MDQ4504041.1 NAD(P)H-dependent oxidoreductase [Sinomonas sp. ASV322]